MKKYLLTLAAFAVSMFSMADDVPAFPGAEGHGRYVTGGRASDGSTKVYHVTNLSDDANTQGSLRWCLEQSGPRTIVFDVSGYIDLKSQLDISSNTTIAGQTAPSPGITLRYYTVYFGSCDNVIVRYLRFRRSQVKDVNDGADATWGRKKSKIILDHCSFSWSIDEVASFYDNNNFTLQWCTIGEAQNDAGHGKGNHSYGGIWGGKLASFHHNLLIHLNNRTPRFNGARYQWTGYTGNQKYNDYKWKNYIQAENVDFRNCVIYNWGQGNGCYGGPGGGYTNIVNNYYKAGPGTKNTKLVTQISMGESGNSTPEALIGMSSRYYINGNHVTAAGSSAANYDWKGVTIDSPYYTLTDPKTNNKEAFSIDKNHLYGDTATYVANTNGDDCVRIKLYEPCPIGEITTHTAEKTYEKVLKYSGASLYSDDIDSRFFEETKAGVVTYTGIKTGIKGIVDIINDPEATEQNDKCPSFPVFISQSRAADFDADNDGMADAWEQANGGDLDPNAYTIDSEKKWYTNLEVYLNSLVEDIMKAGNADGESNYTEYYPKYTPTGISTIRTSAITATEYYDLNGRKLAAPMKGVNIRVERMANGQNITSKVIK